MRRAVMAAWALAACDATTTRTALDDAATATDAVTADAVVADVVTATDVVTARDVVTAVDVAVTADVPVVDVVATPDAVSSGCAGTLCDGFEDVAAGGPPSSARWSVVSPNCAGAGRLAVDDAMAHGGRHALRVDGRGGYCDHVFFATTGAPPVSGDDLYGRVFVRFGAALGDGHVTFATMRDTADGNRDLRLGGQSRIMMWNRESDDATLPELSPTGIARSLAPAVDRWLCVEFHVDMAAGALQTWVDGAPVEGLTVDATPTADTDAQWLRRGAWRPRLTDVKFGWESYAGQSMTLWFDDVALGPRRIGCGG